MAVISVALDGQPREVRFSKLIMAGYTGRNQAEAQAHIDELKAHGIPAPERIPTLYACAPALLTTGEEIAVLGHDTSGEAEFVLFPSETEGELLVGVGSDHTDRALETTDIPRAKQLCAKTVSREVWRLADVVDHWDDLILRSWVGDGSAETLYQEGPLARLLSPEGILATVATNTSEQVAEAVVFSGTLPILGGVFLPAPFFQTELADPIRGRSLRCGYRVQVMDYLR
jgi:hypothetical protein